MKRVALIGVGLLGSEFLNFRDSYPIDFYNISEDVSRNIKSLDILNLSQLEEVFKTEKYSHIINCVAYTNVDGAESNVEDAFLLNAKAVKNIAQIAKKYNCSVLHYSTDYVVGKELDKQVLVKEDDNFSPYGIYGISKMYGEDFLTSILDVSSYLIVRTSWVHGVNGPNFIDTIIKVAKEKSFLKVVSDQIGSPTYAPFLAENSLNLFLNGTRGILNISSRGNISWYDYAVEILKIVGIDVQVEPQSTAESNRPAKRPPYSTLSLDKFENIIGKSAYHWRDGVISHLRERGLDV